MFAVAVLVAAFFTFAQNINGENMEGFNFDMGGLLLEDEAEKLFEEQVPEEESKETDVKDTDTAEDVESVEDSSPEEVGGGTKDVEEAVPSEGDGSSPNVYSSIASALKKDGIFPDFEDSELEAVKTPDDFAELFEKAISAKLDERQKRIDSALSDGVQPDVVRSYEQTIQYLDSIEDEQISDESEAGENLRRQLIYNDLINRGYSQEKAQKELEKSFKSGSDVDDAKDALEALSRFYKDGYDKIRNDAKSKAEENRKELKKREEDFRKSVIDDELKLGDMTLDKRTRQKVYDSVTKPVYKDPDTGRLLTAVQKFQKENPDEFLRQIGMWYVLTDGGKSIDGLTKDKVRAEKNKGIRELERKINSTALNADGSLKYASGSGSAGSGDILLSDEWSIG